VGFAYAMSDVPGGRRREVLSAHKGPTGRKPGVYRRSDGRIRIECYEGYLEGFMCYTELAEAIAKWLEETGRR